MANANISFEIYSKEFKSKVSKQAYMQCIKWLATHIYNKPEIAKSVSVRITKDQSSKIPTFNLTIYLDVDREELRKNFCGKCKMIHSIFYSIDKFDCKECKMNAYYIHNDKYARNLQRMFREIIEDGEDKESN